MSRTGQPAKYPFRKLGLGEGFIARRTASAFASALAYWNRLFAGSRSFLTLSRGPHHEILEDAKGRYIVVVRVK